MDSFEEQNRENDNIVNYGEIDEDEIAHANEPSYDSFTSNANKEINVNQLKSNATDIDNILSPKKEDTKHNKMNKSKNIR